MSIDQPAPADPFTWFETWFAEARETEINDSNAMTLATCGPGGMPSARMVLLKGIDGADRPDRGFVFYTNLQGRKAADLAQNAAVGLLFHWKSRRRQIRIEGHVTRASGAEADAYFASRHRLSRLGAWASDQSRPLPSRAALEARLVEAEARFPGDDIPRPSYWGGFRVIPAYFEFWQDMPYRLHDRTTYSRPADGHGAWEIGKLYP